MTVLFSKKCEYALQALQLMAEFHGKGPLSADQIAYQLDIPKEYISKILQGLAKSDIVVSQRGNAGGFKLGRDPDSIHLMDIVEKIDGPDVFDDCLIGFVNCNSEQPCPLHETWGAMRSDLTSFLQLTHLQVTNPERTLKADTK